MENVRLVNNSGRAAMYVRMSTEHQQYSTENQADAIQKYAGRRNLVIVKTFVDHGRSGLTLSGRLGLSELLEEVQSGTADYEAILVYDVSRWGRFQDSDESAYYEYRCKRAQVQVHYCAEQFENDGSPLSALLKTIKRSMAAEYSRELSVKVFAGQSRLTELGFRQGGLPGFGLRRQLVGLDGVVKQVLERGERKSIQNDRVILVPGPEEEVKIVQKIFDLYTAGGMGARRIARLLNEQGVPWNTRKRWTHDVVHTLLKNPKYVGAAVYNRTSFKLSKQFVRNPPSMWVRRDDAFKPIIPLEQFERAQLLMEQRSVCLKDEDMLEQLRQLWKRVGRLSADLVNGEKEIPSVQAFLKHFGSFHNAYSLIGYRPDLKNKYDASIARHKVTRQNIFDATRAKLQSSGASVEECGPEGLLLVNGQVTVRLRLCYCRHTTTGGYRWTLHPEPTRCDVTIAIRLRPGNREILDYFLIPNSHRPTETFQLLIENRCDVDVHRFETLDSFANLLRRCSLTENS
jgi:DNA invertase Pin-like site-specific DNA recombinase